jgi:hypothetical protein
MDYWKPLYGDGGHYNIASIKDEDDAMNALRALFPEGGKSVDEMNFVLFSTSGVHGTYGTIEEAEEDKELSVTMLVVHPRLVTLKYGNVTPDGKEDFDFLKDIRKASWEVVQTIGR